MQYEEASWYSNRVERVMSIRIYGHFGLPILAFPCQNGGSDDLYNNGMIDALSDLLEAGKIKLYCVDTVDNDSVSYKGWDKGRATYLLEMYHHYIIEEALPFIYLKQGGHCMPLCIGASMGGSHASNMFFRRPDCFMGFIALSTSFDYTRYFDGYMDSNVYNNSPVHYLENIDPFHPYINIYNNRKMIAVVGDGDWEWIVKDTYPWLEDICNKKHIPVEFHYWDNNAKHDWSSWNYEMAYFLKQIV